MEWMGVHTTMMERIEKMRSEEGFTLVELLVVIVILAVLAAVVVFAVSGINDRGQQSACEADQQTLQHAQEAFSATRRGANDEPVPYYAADSTELQTAGFLSGDIDVYNTTAGTDPDTNGPQGYTVDPVGACTNLVGQVVVLPPA